MSKHDSHSSYDLADSIWESDASCTEARLGQTSHFSRPAVFSAFARSRFVHLPVGMASSSLTVELSNMLGATGVTGFDHSSEVSTVPPQVRRASCHVSRSHMQPIRRTQFARPAGSANTRCLEGVGLGWIWVPSPSYILCPKHQDPPQALSLWAISVSIAGELCKRSLLEWRGPKFSACCCLTGAPASTAAGR